MRGTALYHHCRRYGQLEKGADLKLTPAQGGAASDPEAPSVIVAEDVTRLLRLLLALPHGALKKSHALAGGGTGASQLGGGCASWAGIGRLASWEVVFIPSPCSPCSHAVHLLAPTCAPASTAFPARPAFAQCICPYPSPSLNCPMATPCLPYTPPPSLVPQPHCASFSTRRLLICSAATLWPHRISQMPLARPHRAQAWSRRPTTSPRCSHPRRRPTTPWSS